MPEGPARPRRRAIVAIGVGAVTIDAALLGLIAPLLPDIEARTGAGDAALGLALAACATHAHDQTGGSTSSPTGSGRP